MEDFPRGGLLHRFATVHDQGAIRHFRHHAHIVRNEQNRHALFFLQRFDQRQNLRLNGDIQRGRRLVCDQQTRVTGQRDGNHHALTHAAGKAQRIFIES